MAGFLEPGEQFETMLPGETASFINAGWSGRKNRQVVLTDRNLNVFEVAGSERCPAGTPSKVLSKYRQGSAPVRYRAFPVTLIVGDEKIRPMRDVLTSKKIARAAGPPAETAGTT